MHNKNYVSKKLQWLIITWNEGNEIEVHAKNKEDVKLVIIAITELIYKHIPTFLTILAINTLMICINRCRRWMYMIDIQLTCFDTSISIPVASTIAMTRNNITMKMQKMLIFPLIVMLMLSSILVASRKSCWLLQHQPATNTIYMIKFDSFRQFYTMVFRNHGFLRTTMQPSLDMDFYGC